MTLDVVLNEGGPHAPSASINSALGLEFPGLSVAENILLREYAQVARSWLASHANGGTLFEAVDAIMHTTPI